MFAAFAVACCLVAAVAVAGRVHTAALSAVPIPAAASKHAISVGVWQPGAPASIGAIRSFQRQTGVHAGIVNWFESWEDTQGSPDLSLFRTVEANGSEPMLTWEPQYSTLPAGVPQIKLSDIAAGRYDAFVTRWASGLASMRKPIMLRWAHEMNGDWYPWGAGISGNSPAEFVAAWRHVHDVFAAAGAQNVQWVWCPNVVSGPADPLESLYPGDAYVDWVGLDGYNRTLQGSRSFTAIFQASYIRLTALTAKPLLIGEFGSGAGTDDPEGLAKSAWIHSALTLEIPNLFPQVRAVLWFNENKLGVENQGEDWSLDTAWERWEFAQAARRSPYTGKPPTN